MPTKTKKKKPATRKYKTRRKPPSKTAASPEKVIAVDQRTQALNLRRDGHTFREIAEQMGFSEVYAHRLVTEELRRLNEEKSETAAEVLRLANERLDHALTKLKSGIEMGRERAIEAMLAIETRRAKMYGLDAADKVEMTGKGGKDLIPEDARLEEKRAFLLGVMGVLSKAGGDSTLPPLGEAKVPVVLEAVISETAPIPVQVNGVLSHSNGTAK